VSSREEPGRRGILFLFLDGVGLAPAGPDNPFSTVPMPHLEAALGAALLAESAGQEGRGEGGEWVLCALDACLGVPGLPQSATGQTALFTGVNAPAAVGEHITAWPTAALRAILAEHSLLKQAAALGARVLLANAHSERFWQMIRERKRGLGASTLTALAAGIPIPTLDDLAAGRAVLWDITHEIARQHLGYDLPLVAPEEAGARLARLAGEYDLVLFESFLSDLAGHGRLDAAWVLTRLDRFLGGLLAQRSPETTVVLSSDHGNLEDLSARRHTTNPVPLLALGPAAGHFRGVRALTDVTPRILSAVAAGLGARRQMPAAPGGRDEGGSCQGG
jgi:2,3-bisphosphoglycerate-independent phosphoglycerate mutase